MTLDRIMPNTQKRLLTTLLKIKVWKGKGESLSIKDSWNNIKSCIICLPREALSDGETKPVIERLQERFPQAKISVIALPNTNDILLDEQIGILKVKQEDINYLGLPKRSIINKIQELKADIAIDLSLAFVPISAYLCFLSGARIKIGFVVPGSDLVFNYQIAPNQHRTGVDRYQVLAQYIG